MKGFAKVIMYQCIFDVSVCGITQIKQTNPAALETVAVFGFSKWRNKPRSLLAIYPAAPADILKSRLLGHMKHPPAQQRQHHRLQIGTLAFNFLEYDLQVGTQPD